VIFRGVITEDGKYFLPDSKREWEALKQSLAGYEVDVELRKHRSKRSLDQNAFFHAAIAPLAEHLGYTTEELKLDLLGTKYGWHELKSGTKVPLRLHTSDLNTKDFAELMDHTIQIAAEEGILILDPSQWKAQKKRSAKTAAKVAA
jgi:hypothetical protein